MTGLIRGAYERSYFRGIGLRLSFDLLSSDMIWRSWDTFSMALEFGLEYGVFVKLASKHAFAAAIEIGYN